VVLAVVVVVVAVVVVATAAAADDDNKDYNDDDDGDDDDDDEDDALSAEYLDGVLEGRICGTVHLACAAKRGGAPTNCRDLPDLDEQAIGVAEVDQACMVCEAEHAVHNDGVLLSCRTFKTCRICGTSSEGHLWELQDLWDLQELGSGGMSGEGKLEPSW